MDKNKQERNKLSDSSSTSAPPVPSVKPSRKAGKPKRDNTDKEYGSNDQFPSAL